MGRIEILALKIQELDKKLVSTIDKKERSIIIKQTRRLTKEYNHILGSKLRILYNLYQEIYFYYPIFLIPICEQWTDGFITLYRSEEDNNFAELNNTWWMPVTDRIRIHEKYLAHLKGKNSNKSTKPEYSIMSL